MNLHAFYRGRFGRKAALLFQMETGCSISNIIEHQTTVSYDYSHVVIFLSDLSSHGLVEFSESFINQNIRWTSVYLSPRSLRIGPLITSKGVCFSCANNRHKSHPGLSSNTNVEHFVNELQKMNINFEAEGFLPSMIDIAVTESYRQLNDENLSAGFIRKIDLLSLDVSSTIAIPVHGCQCNKYSIQTVPGERFYRKLKEETRYLFKESI